MNEAHGERMCGICMQMHFRWGQKTNFFGMDIWWFYKHKGNWKYNSISVNSSHITTCPMILFFCPMNTYILCDCDCDTCPIEIDIIRSCHRADDKWEQSLYCQNMAYILNLLDVQIHVNMCDFKLLFN